MAFRKTKLDNGARVVTDDMPGVRSVTLGFWYRVGSRDERPEQAGLTHFMEHMMFKGTRSRTALEISEAFDDLGAESNAFTTKEYTCYHSRFVDEKVDAVLSLLADMVLDSQFRDEDIEPEREVVLEEIARSEDEPDDHVFELCSAAFWPDHALGRPVLGTEERVSSYRQGDCRAFHAAHYHSGNLVISAAGNIDHGQLADKAARALSGMAQAPQPGRARDAQGARMPFVAQKREIEQAHLVCGYPWFAAGDDDRFAGSLLAAILGGSASSRLFQEVREKNGLAYSVFSGATAYSDAGQFNVYCATRPDNLAKAAAIIRREISRAVQDPPGAAELKRACEVTCSQLLMEMESTGSRMARIGRRETMGLPQMPVAEMVDRYRAVTPDDVCRVARRHLSAEPTVSVVSPYGEDEARELTAPR